MVLFFLNEWFHEDDLRYSLEHGLLLKVPAKRTAKNRQRGRLKAAIDNTALTNSLVLIV